MSDVQTLLDRLEKVRGKGPRWRALCPAHDNKNTLSLAITETPENRILIHCFAGCGASDVMQAIGLKLSDLMQDDGRKDWKKDVQEKKGHLAELNKAFVREVLLVSENHRLKIELKKMRGHG